jgi:hypothetical protein
MTSTGRLEERLDFIAVGHVTLDRVAGDRRLGGAAAFAAITASRLGLRTALVTSAAPDFPFWDDLAGVEIHCQAARQSTEFENFYASGTRRQRVLGLAGAISKESLDPVRGRLAGDAAVLYCPVVHEIDLVLEPLVPGGLCGAAPQGFFRRWSPEGMVEPRDWEGALEALSSCDVVSMSEEDHLAPEELAESFPGRAFAVTRGRAGLRLYSGADIYDLPSFPATEVDPTGAGDVFAAAFLIALREGKPVVTAARWAACAAALSVEAPGVEGIPTRRVLTARLQAYG